MKNTHLIWLFVGLILIGISIPLIFAKVPPNDWYGFRVAKTFSSRSIWYAANKVAGYDLLWSGIAVVITSVITWMLHDQRKLALRDRLDSTVTNTINLTVLLVTLLLAVVHSFWYLNRL